MMRVLVVQRPTINKIDGLPLDAFELGQEYQLGNQLGALFLAEGWGVPAPFDGPSPPAPFGPDDPYDHRRLYHNRAHTGGAKPRDRAHDSSTRRRAARRKRD